MISALAKERLEKQQYRVVGSHSTVKTCGWTKKMIRGQGGCYKLKFYGIMSNQCLQMSTSMMCANRCVFCWRDYKSPVDKEWKFDVDDPKMILDESVKAHHQLLIGFKGYDKVNKEAYAQSQEVKHVALSLTGEPINYPKINEILKLFNQKEISTFLVTNAQYPDEIRKLVPVTQLYLSIDAPTKEILKKVDNPLFTDYWERMIQCLEKIKTRKDRTCIRLTLIKGLNDSPHEKYAELIKIGEPDFIEVKAYMFVGASRQRLTKDHMPLHEEIVIFSKALVKYLDDYEIVAEHIPSRVVMLARKKFKKNGKWMTWIDFKKWNALVNSEKEFSVDDYLKETPSVGISGKGTLDLVEKRKGKEEAESLKKKIFVNEDTDEIELWKDDGC